MNLPLKILFILFFICLIPDNSFSQITEVWSDVYDHNSTSNIVKGMDVDPSGNVYVTGYGGGTYDNVITIKYDVNGLFKWAKEYDSGQNRNDRGFDIAVDSYGNSYVVGFQNTTQTNDDILLIKYSTAGVEEWVRTISGTAQGNDRGYAVTVDNNNNVILTGHLFLGSTYGSCVTVKYDPSGIKLWQQTYALANGPDEGRVLITDQAGNVYVGANSEGGANFTNFTILKYSSGGTLLWDDSYDAYGQDDIVNAIAIDGNGNVALTGESWHSSNYYNFTTTKYDASGNNLWTKHYNSGGTNTDRANDLVFDASGNLYVFGHGDASSSVVGSPNMTLVKYDVNGNEVWVDKFTKPSWTGTSHLGYAIDIDASGNIWVGGNIKGNYDGVTTIKYDNSGTVLWDTTFAQPYFYTDAQQSFLKVTNSGDIIHSASSQGTFWDDYLTVKYSDGFSGGGGSNSTYCVNYNSSSNFNWLSNYVTISPSYSWAYMDTTIKMDMNFSFLGTQVDSLYFDGDEIALVNNSTGIFAYVSLGLFQAMDRGYPTGVSSYVDYEVSGTPGNYITKIGFYNVGSALEYYNLGSLNQYIDFQVWFYEGTNNIEYHFGPTSITDPNNFFDYGPAPSIYITDLNDAYFVDGMITNPSILHVPYSSTIQIEFLDNLPQLYDVLTIFQCAVGVEESEVVSDEKLFLYPNPTNGVVRWGVENFNVENVLVYDMYGKLIIEKNIEGLNNGIVDLSFCKSGAYIAKFMNLEKVVSKVVVVK